MSHHYQYFFYKRKKRKKYSSLLETKSSGYIHQVIKKYLVIWYMVILFPIGDQKLSIHSPGGKKIFSNLVPGSSLKKDQPVE